MSGIAAGDLDNDMILDLVKRHVAITSTLPVFEVEVPGRPSIQRRVLDALSQASETHQAESFLDGQNALKDFAKATLSSATGASASGGNTAGPLSVSAGPVI